MKSNFEQNLVSNPKIGKQKTIVIQSDNSYTKEFGPLLGATLAHIEQILIVRITEMAHDYSRRPQPFFRVFLNLIVSLSVIHKRDIFKSIHLLNSVSDRVSVRNAYVAASLRQDLGLARKLVLINGYKQSTQVRFDPFADRPSLNSLIPPNYGLVLSYLDQLDDAKRLAREALAMKKRVMDDLLLGKADCKWSVDFGRRLTANVHAAEACFATMRGWYRQAYTPTAIVEHNYRVHVTQDEYASYKRLLETVQKRFAGDLLQVANDVHANGQECSIVTASLERDDF